MLRCAAYTRKSSEEGLDQTFNSLHAQRDACEAYIRSQIGEGWSCLPDAYDDGGISGATMERPGLKRLMADVGARHVDVVVVYKVDRLTRSLGDFARIVETFDRCGVSFVSVTQAFNTTSSMGRLTLNVLLSFAQFEREVTGERIRDKKAAARARGLWSTGRPYGYLCEDGRLTPHPTEAATIRRIYRRYVHLGSLDLLTAELAASGVVGKRGGAMSVGVVARVLRNRLYRGELVHGGEASPGRHLPLVTEREWSAVRRQMADSGRRRAARRRAPVHAMLRGLLYTADGHALVHTFVRRRERLYRYYVSGREAYGPDAPSAGRFRAAELEAAVLRVAEHLAGVDMTGRSETDASALVRQLVERVDVTPDDMRVQLKAGGVIRAEHAGRTASGRRTALTS